MLTEQDIIERLWLWGHFHHPVMGEGIAEGDLQKLNLKSPAVRNAVHSYQEFFREDLELACINMHGRRLVIDGDYGPATEYLMSQARCGRPDYEHQFEEANWPDSCRMEITVSYDFDSLNLDNDTIRQAWQLALKSWEDRIVLRFDLQDTFSKRTRIWATDGPLPGSTLAWSMLAQSNCNATLEQRYDTTVTWRLTFLQATICHEVGHALGSGHLSSRSAIMFPSISSLIVPGDPDIANMVRLGYRRNDDPSPPPDDPPPIPPGAKNILTGSVGGDKYVFIGIKTGN